MKSYHSTQASALITTVIFTAFTAMVVASLLIYTTTETRLNARNNLRFEAKNAAEALTEYAAAELKDRFDANLNFTTATLTTYPLTVFEGRSPLFFTASSDSPCRIDPTSSEVWVSNTTPGKTELIDSMNPANRYDPLVGQTVATNYVRILAKVTARSPSGESVSVFATEAFQVRNVDLFKYAIFYNVRMEFHPSPEMHIYGPVHSNKDVFLTEGNTLSFHDTFTTAGSLTAGSYSSGRPATRRISFAKGLDTNADGVADTAGTMTSIQSPTLPSSGTTLSTYVDSSLNSRDSTRNFKDVASEVWRGYVQDSSHGVIEQNPPGTLTPEDARKLIDPPDTSSSANEVIENQKYSRKSGVYILVESNGTATIFRKTPTLATDIATYKSKTASERASWRSSNRTKLLTAPSGMITVSNSMKDKRENKWISIAEIDMGKMRTAITPSSSSPFTTTNTDGDTVNWNPDGEWTGGLYIDVENPAAGWNSGTTASAVRIANATRLPSLDSSTSDAGLAIATNGPIYIKGHFNADGDLSTGDERNYESNEVAASIAADSINVLSPNWNDAHSDMNMDSTHRRAADTEISAAFLTGIVETAASGSTNYSGGVENYPRFHEDWGSKKLRYRGSIVALFTSRYATGPWSSASYGAPVRQWGYNKKFAEGIMPPLTPRNRTYRRVDYRDLSSAEFEALKADFTFGFTKM